MISLFTLKCQEKASECLKYGKTIWRPGLCLERLGELIALFSVYFVLCRFIESTDIMIAFNYVW